MHHEFAQTLIRAVLARTGLALPSGRSLPGSFDVRSAGGECLQLFDQLAHVSNQEDHPLTHFVPSDLQRARNALQRVALAAVLLQERSQRGSVVDQPLAVLRRQRHQHCRVRCRGAGGRMGIVGNTPVGGRSQIGGALLQYYMHIGSPDSKAADPRAPRRCLPGFIEKFAPLMGFAAQVERTAFQLQIPVRFLEVRVSGNRAVLHHKQDLDDARDTRGSFEVADVGLQRSQRAVSLRRARNPALLELLREGRLESIAFHRVSQDGAGAVRLDIANRAHIHARVRIRVHQ